MQSNVDPGARSAPLVTLQVSRLRRRVAASDAVTALLCELAFGPARDSWAWRVTTPAAEVR